jgi:uncharacterized protein YfaT (DUF1175 family)
VPALLLACLLIGGAAIRRDEPRPLEVALSPVELPADGRSMAALVIEDAAGGPWTGGIPRVSVGGHPGRVRIVHSAAAGQGWQARVRAGVLPGRVALRVEAPGFIPAAVELTLAADWGDRDGDGTPDFLDLDEEQDQQAFRRWFAFLAEAQYFQDPALRPGEIDDCAALIRYAYREALRAHDSGWGSAAGLPLVAGLEAVTKYQYPHTPLGAALFRVRRGPFQPADLSSGGFAQFADAKTLLRWNTHFVSRDIERAMAGDLLFYRQATESMPFHSMIHIGPSQINDDGSPYVLYHTGPDGTNPGEMRRMTTGDLLRHPNPRWRPTQSNATFLGVYRWSILR